jgi:hypothetical protein
VGLAGSLAIYHQKWKEYERVNDAYLLQNQKVLVIEGPTLRSWRSHGGKK